MRAMEKSGSQIGKLANASEVYSPQRKLGDRKSIRSSRSERQIQTMIFRSHTRAKNALSDNPQLTLGALCFRSHSRAPLPSP
jgi:hypothetical protein